MNCCPCFSSQKCQKEPDDDAADAAGAKKPKPRGEAKEVDHGNITSQNFTFRELASATKNFRQECLLGEGGFGRVYKGTLQGTGQVVAVKQLDRHGLQGNKEFLVEVLMLSLLHHENLVNLIGYCADGDQRLLVYEYMPGGSLEDHLFDIGPQQKPLDWLTRMKIAFGAAQGLEYLHHKANPPVIFRDLKSSNILLDEAFNPKLSDFGLAKLGPAGDKMHVSSRVMGTYGYCAPEYARSGELTLKSDVFSFGVVLLELITGRKAIDTTKPIDEQNLVAWAQPKFRDPKLYPDMADPLLERRFPEKALNQAVAIVAMCLQEEASVRPLIGDVVTTLSFLLVAPPEPVAVPPPEPNKHSQEANGSESDSSNSESDEEECDKDNTSGEHQNRGDEDSAHKRDAKVDEGRELDNDEDRKSTDKGSDSGSSRRSSMSRDESVERRDRSSWFMHEESIYHSHKTSLSNGSMSSAGEMRRDSGKYSLSHKSSGRSSDGVDVSSPKGSSRYSKTASLDHAASLVDNDKGSSQDGSYDMGNSQHESHAISRDSTLSSKRDNSEGSIDDVDSVHSRRSSINEHVHSSS
ncbi:hypothetical protein BT93_A0826 [Corymbia citriodora subsp. variegata]|nr:hypothetical protein BT93_A0826 [Corymbia citriodora subsp. variegata]